MPALSDLEFVQFQRFIHQAAGISLAPTKKALVGSRLARRLELCGLASYGEYLRLIRQADSQKELQTAIDLLTTNETYFFREPKHFDFLKRHLHARTPRSQPMRIWSAAGSTGEEAYSIAMMLQDCLPTQPWEVLASDISQRVLERARRAHYSCARTEHIPRPYLKRFCLKGHGVHEGTLLIERSLRKRVQFKQINLNAPLPDVGLFDFLFLRNVLIYFDAATKRQVVNRLLATLRPGGWLFIGHSENLAGVNDTLEHVAPAIFRKPS